LFNSLFRRSRERLGQFPHAGMSVEPGLSFGIEHRGEHGKEIFTDGFDFVLQTLLVLK